MEEKEKIYVFLYESTLQSIIRDLFTFGSLIAVLTINYKIWNGDWYVTCTLLFLWLLALVGRSSKLKNSFYSKQELLDYLNKDTVDK